MTYNSTFALSTVGCKGVFDRLLGTAPRQSWHLPFLTEFDATVNRFFITLLAEEVGQRSCSAEQATYEGDRVLLLLDRLFHLIEESAENHRLIISLAVSIGRWIALKGGEIKELDLIVSGIATYANESKTQQDLENLHDVSLRVLRAADDFIKADLDKRNPKRPWRLLCLNHCIIATRTGNGDLARSAYDRLIKFLPEEAEGFFRMGLEKIRAGQFTLQCRHVMDAYYQMYCSDDCARERSCIHLH